jgi:methylated-DNA-[protein]-cysteine S-methyltransferase
MEHLNIAELESPIGTITVAVRNGRLSALSFGNHWAEQVRWLERRFGAIDFTRSADPAGVVSVLRAYFDGELTAIDRIDVDMGGTPFQASVWFALRRVPAGHTTSYGALARAVGSPHAARAVGAANGQNPVSIVVPCHRAIGGDGRLVGYGGGLDRKRWLLQHEGWNDSKAERSRLKADTEQQMALSLSLPEPLRLEA